MRKIPLTQGKVALVDDWWFDELNQHKWHAAKFSGIWYAARNGKKQEGDLWCKKILMHRVVNKTPKDMETDHKDRNGMNNQEGNLRNATSLQNMRNQKSRLGVSSRYKGVHWCKNAKKWLVYSRANGRKYALGGYDCEIEAAKAYNQFAINHHGEFAYLNEVDNG